MSALATEPYVAAVFDLKAEEDVSRSLATTLSDEFRRGLINTGKLTVMDRTKMEELFKAQGFNLDECTDRACAVQMGSILPTDKLIIGRISRLGDRFHLFAEMIDQEDGRTMFAKSLQARIVERNLPQCVVQLSENIAQEIHYVGSVTRLLPQSEILIDLGKSTGTGEDAVLLVKRPEEYKVRTVGRLEVISQPDDYHSLCRIIRSTGSLMVGDLVAEELDYVPPARSRRTTVLMSTLVPGAGQVRYGHWRGVGYFVGTAASLYLALSQGSQFDEARRDHDEAGQLYHNAIDPQAAGEYYRRWEDAYSRMDSHGKQRTVYAWGAGILWTANLVDAYFIGGRKDKVFAMESDATPLTIAFRRSSEGPQLALIWRVR